MHLLGHDFCWGLNFNPLGEVIHCDKEEFDLTFHRGNWSENVHSLHGERPRTSDDVKYFRWCVVDTAEFLTFFAFFDALGAILPQGRPVVSSSYDPCCHASPSGVHSAYSFVHLVQDIYHIALIDALQQIPTSFLVLLLCLLVSTESPISLLMQGEVPAKGALTSKSVVLVVFKCLYIE